MAIDYIVKDFHRNSCEIKVRPTQNTAARATGHSVKRRGVNGTRQVGDVCLFARIGPLVPKPFRMNYGDFAPIAPWGIQYANKDFPVSLSVAMKPPTRATLSILSVAQSDNTPVSIGEVGA